LSCILPLKNLMMGCVAQYEFLVAGHEAGQRLDHFLAVRELPQSRSQLQRLIDEGFCRVNGEVVRPAKWLKKGDTVSLTLPPPVPAEAKPEVIPLVVLYEDPDLIVIDKPAGLVVHPAAGHHSGTLVNALLAHCQELSGVGGTLRPGIVHRLDMGTSGVMVATKSDRAHLHLAKQFSVHSIERLYLAVVLGTLSSPRGIFDTRHCRHPRDRKRFTGRCPGGRRAITHYRVLQSWPGATLIEARLETGRSHQVRMHFAEGGHAVLGDPVYGRPPKNPLLRTLGRDLGRQALHAHLLGFDHPVSGQHLRFTSPLPKEIQIIVDALDANQQDESNG
jgi:23S rRNA pseudouridine1911/1915/1917 synthase